MALCKYSWKLLGLLRHKQTVFWLLIVFGSRPDFAYCTAAFLGEVSAWLSLPNCVILLCSFFRG